MDYVSIKVSATVAPHSPWAFDDAVEHAVRALAPLFRIAATASGGQKFINLDMEEYKDLDLTLAVFTSLLDRDDFLGLEAGIVLQAYLPDALGAMIALQRWSRARLARGGAPVKVRVVKGEPADGTCRRGASRLAAGDLADEAGIRCAYLAVLDYALRAEHVDAVTIGVAGPTCSMQPSPGCWHSDGESPGDRLRDAARDGGLAGRGGP